MTPLARAPLAVLLLLGAAGCTEDAVHRSSAQPARSPLVGTVTRVLAPDTNLFSVPLAADPDEESGETGLWLEDYRDDARFEITPTAWFVSALDGREVAVAGSTRTQGSSQSVKVVVDQPNALVAAYGLREHRVWCEMEIRDRGRPAPL